MREKMKSAEKLISIATRLVFSTKYGPKRINRSFKLLEIA